MSIKSTRTLKRSEAQDMYRRLLQAQLNNIENLTDEQLGDALDDFYEFDNFLIEDDEDSNKDSTADVTNELAHFYR